MDSLFKRLQRTLAHRFGDELATRTAADISVGEHELCRCNLIDAAILIKGSLLTARRVAQRHNLPVPSEQDCADALPGVVAVLVRHVDRKLAAAVELAS